MAVVTDIASGRKGSKSSLIDPITGRSRSLAPPSSETYVPKNSVLDAAPKGYESLYDANPYKDYNYTDGFWDKIGDALGFRTQQDKYREEMEMASREYESQIASIAREEKYNSAEDQAQRERDAGLNPDLIGNVGAGEASEFNEPETRPEVPADSGKSFFGQISTIATTVLGLSKDVEAFRSLQIANDMNDAEYANKLLSYAGESIYQTAGPEAVSTDDLISRNGRINPALSLKLSGLFHSKRSERSFNKAISSSVGSWNDRIKRYGKSKDLASSRLENASKLADPAFRDEDKDMTDFMKVMSNAAYESIIAELNASTKHNKDASRYFDKRAKLNSPEAQAVSETMSDEYNSRLVTARNNADIPEAIAGAEGAELDLRTNQANYTNSLEDTKRKVVVQLNEQAKKGNVWSSIALMLMSSLNWSSVAENVIGSYLHRPSPAPVHNSNYNFTNKYFGDFVK